jgi:hypothetical protein
MRCRSGVPSSSPSDLTRQFLGRLPHPAATMPAWPSPDAAAWVAALSLGRYPGGTGIQVTVTVHLVEESSVDHGPMSLRPSVCNRPLPARQ